ncbi:MAG: RDD family protein [Gammaproteobacteria bacterium]|nr:RDD family protein [Gammaproteobacteria bacterium]
MSGNSEASAGNASPVGAGAPVAPRDPMPVGWLRRLAVMFYDSLLLFGVLFAATFILLPFTRGQPIGPNDTLYTLYLLAVSYGYFGWFWTRGGQTLGMRAWRVTLVADPPRVLDWRRCLLRFAAALISWAPAGMGFVWAIFDSEKLTWHDRLSGTRLVYQRRAGS